MMNNISAGWGSIIFSLGVAFTFTILPLPTALMHWRPAWVALVVIYWVVAQPHLFGVVSAWITGLLLDVLLNNVLGQNALALSVIAYTTYVLHMRIRVFPLWQQCLSILVLVGIYMLISLVIIRAVHPNPTNVMYWLPAVISALMWPWLVLGLGFFHNRSGG